MKFRIQEKQYCVYRNCLCFCCNKVPVSHVPCALYKQRACFQSFIRKTVWQYYCYILTQTTRTVQNRYTSTPVVISHLPMIIVISVFIKCHTKWHIRTCQVQTSCNEHFCFECHHDDLLKDSRKIRKTYIYNTPR